MVREVLDQSPIEINKPKEGLYFLLIVWDGPFCHSHNFYWVHLDGVMGDDHPEVLHLASFKLALVWLQK